MIETPVTRLKGRGEIRAHVAKLARQAESAAQSVAKPVERGLRRGGVVARRCAARGHGAHEHGGAHRLRKLGHVAQRERGAIRDRIEIELLVPERAAHQLDVARGGARGVVRADHWRRSTAARIRSRAPADTSAVSAGASGALRWRRNEAGSIGPCRACRRARCRVSRDTARPPRHRTRESPWRRTRGRLRGHIERACRHARRRWPAARRHEDGIFRPRGVRVDSRAHRRRRNVRPRLPRRLRRIVVRRLGFAGESRRDARQRNKTWKNPGGTVHAA